MSFTIEVAATFVEDVVLVLFCTPSTKVVFNTCGISQAKKSAPWISESCQNLTSLFVSVAEVLSVPWVCDLLDAVSGVVTDIVVDEPHD